MRLLLFSISIVFLLSLFAVTVNAGHQVCWTQTVPTVDDGWASARDLAMQSPTDIFALGGGAAGAVKFYDGTWYTISDYGGLYQRDGLLHWTTSRSTFIAGRNGSDFNNQFAIVFFVRPSTALKLAVYAKNSAGSRIPNSNLSFKAFVLSDSNAYAIVRNTVRDYDVILFFNTTTREWVGKQFTGGSLSSWAPDVGGNLLVGAADGGVYTVSPAISSSNLGNLGSPIFALASTSTRTRFALAGDPSGAIPPTVYRSITLGSWSAVNTKFYGNNSIVGDVAYSFYAGRIAVPGSTNAYAWYLSDPTNYAKRTFSGTAIKTAKVGSDLYILSNQPGGQIYKLTCANTALPTVSVNPVPSAIRGVETSLTATASDALDHVTAYLWSALPPIDPTGYTVIGGATSSVYRLNFNKLGSYTFKVVVTDGGFPNRTAFATKTVTVANLLPTANAGPDKTITANSLLVLNASGHDSDGTIASYKWELGSGDGTKVTSRDPADFNGQNITANITAAGTYVFKLTVTDNDGGTARDEVTVTVTAPPEAPVVPVAPTADARVLVGGSSVSTVAINTIVNLSSEATTNPDARPLTYTWNLTSGNASKVLNRSTYNSAVVPVNFTSNGTFTFLLNVSDDRGLFSTDSITLDVTLLGAVAECTVDLDCGDGFACRAGSCVASNVTSCVADSDCSEGLACVAGSCAAVTGAACTDNSGCEANEECLGNSCVALTCRGGEVARNNECVRTCADETDCGSGQICAAGVCQSCTAGQRVVENECVRTSGVARCAGVDHAAGTGQCCNSVWIPGIAQCPLPAAANRTTTPQPPAGGANDLPFLIVGGIIVLLAVVAAAYFLFLKKPPGGSKGGAETTGETAEEAATETETEQEPTQSTDGDEPAENKGRKWI